MTSLTRFAMPLQSCLLNRHTRLVAGPLALHVATPTAQAAPADQPPPVSCAFQAGFSKDARIFGASRDWRKPLRWGDAAGYWESSVGQWRTRHAPEGGRGALVTPVGFTLVLSCCLADRQTESFFELVIGASVLLPIYETGERLHHFFNAGIKRRNPRENTIQLRHATRY
jgi:hypothetical protein